MTEYDPNPFPEGWGIQYRLEQETSCRKKRLHLLGTAYPVRVSVQRVEEALAVHVPYFDRFVFGSCNQKLAIG